MKKRKVEQEKDKQTTGKSSALSSKQMLFYHDVPPELYRRIAKRYTVGHKKYSPDSTMNLNWRIGLDDPLYVMDRLNHMFEHMMDFLEYGNVQDDNLAAIVWSCAFLMEAERHNPEVLEQVIGQCRNFGKSAKLLQEGLEKNQK